MNTPTTTQNNNEWNWYDRQLALFRKRSRVLAKAATSVAVSLEEPNVLAVGRLMEILGEETVRSIAEAAHSRFEAARAEGESAYAPQPKGTVVATYLGVPRSCGGVFFYLIRVHLAEMGLNYAALMIPGLPRDPAPTAMAQPSINSSDGVVQQEPSRKSTAPIPAEARKRPAQDIPNGVDQQRGVPRQAAEATDNAAKPNRLKSTVVGTPIGSPRPTDQPGVLQLIFDVEMTTTMPKGLPTLGRSRVVALCTEKQYRQVAPAGVTPGRMIVEGEAAATSSAAGKPLVVLVCTRLTTVQSEQAHHSPDQHSSGS